MGATTLDDEAVRTALRAVPAPGADESIVEQGYLRGLKVEGGRVSFKLDVPSPLTPARRALAERCRAALSGLVAPDALEVVVEARPVVGLAGPAKGAAPGVKTFIAVGSGKGGVGKSTVAVNLAVGLARAGARVGLLDTDVYGPSVPLLVGVTREAFFEDLQLRFNEGGAQGGQPELHPYPAHGVLTMSLGYLVEPEKAAIWRGPMVHGAIQQLLGDVAWGELDYMIIDLPPGTGDVQLTLAQTIPLSGAVIVCTPQPVALADAYKALNMFQKTKTEVLGLVENMAYHACRHCGGRDDIFGSRGGQDAAKEWQVPFLGSLPLDTRVRESGDAGVPLLATDEQGPLVDALWGVIDRLTQVVAARAKARPRSLPITRT